MVLREHFGMGLELLRFDSLSGYAIKTFAKARVGSLSYGATRTEPLRVGPASIPPLRICY